MQLLTLKALFDEVADELELTWLAGHELGSNTLNSDTYTSHAVADMVGHLNLIHKDRIQVVGELEHAYLAHLSGMRQQHLIAELMAGKPPAFIFADGIAPPQPMLEACARAGAPVLSTPAATASVIDMLRIHLTKFLAERTTMHGVLMDVLGVGVLITGESGLGKSELGLELVSRGHGLVADDVVEITRVAPRTIEGRCPALLKNLLEIRGLGLLDIKTIFGETAVRPKMNIKLMLHLARPHTAGAADYERLPLNANFEEVLSVRVRKVTVPVAAGRNLAVLTEAAVRNTILQLRGTDTMAEFMARQALAMAAPP